MSTSHRLLTLSLTALSLFGAATAWGQGRAGAGSATVSGSEQNRAGSAATSGAGSVTIYGSEQSVSTTYDPCSMYDPSSEDYLACWASYGPPYGPYQVYTYDYGAVNITVNGVTCSTSYDSSDSSSTIASRLATAVNSCNSYASAYVSGSTVNLTARITGASTNYSLSASSASNDSYDFPSPSFYGTPSGSSLTGGTDGTPTVYDAGSAWITVNGQQCSTGYGNGDSSSSVASNLTNAVNSCSSYVNASVSGTTVNLTAKTTGAWTNYSLSSGSSSSQGFSPSFGVSASGGALTGGITGTTTSLSSSQNPSAYSSSVTFTATVSPSSATGTVTFFDGSTNIGSVALSNGSAALTTSSLSVGSHSISASYGGDGNDQGSASSVLTQTVNTANTTISLSSSPSGSQVYGTSITLTATVTPSSADGNVTFYNGSSNLGSSALSNGVATLTTSGLPAGSNSITASYGGNGNYSAVTSAAYSQPMTAVAVTITLSLSTQSSLYGSPVTFTANVTPASAPGSVSFQNGGQEFSQQNLSGGSASYTTASLGAGTDSITAVYLNPPGNANYISNVSAPVQLAIAKATPTVTVSSSVNPSSAGQPVTFTATVTFPTLPSPGPSGGAITFTDSGNSLGSATVISNGSASQTVSNLPAGTHSITANYDGSNDQNFNSASSSSLSQVVNATPLISSLSLNEGPPSMGLVITGSSFGATQGSSTVTLGGVGMAVVAGTWSSTSITVQVPSGASSGNIVVTVGGQASNGFPFQVDSPFCDPVAGCAF